tara:strand:+ start:385 stop:759 length:375 start_codon:yes stop_codon:yes gene_type:complete
MTHDNQLNRKKARLLRRDGEKKRNAAILKEKWYYRNACREHKRQQIKAKRQLAAKRQQAIDKELREEARADKIRNDYLDYRERQSVRVRFSVSPIPAISDSMVPTFIPVDKKEEEDYYFGNIYN